MILNGKTFEDFEKWLSKTYGEFEVTSFQECSYGPIYYVYLDEVELPKTVVNALIIEFFDSVGFYININNLDLQKWFYYDIKYLSIITSFKLYRTRQEATEQAIKEANNIYNERYIN